jgi:hypothetical protein
MKGKAKCRVFGDCLKMTAGHRRLEMWKEKHAPPPAHVGLVTFVGWLILLQPGDGDMDPCRPKIRTASTASPIEKLAGYQGY